MTDTLSNIVAEFHPSAGLIGQGNSLGISNGLLILACSEKIFSTITVGIGMPISSKGINGPVVDMTRYSDNNSAQIIFHDI